MLRGTVENTINMVPSLKHAQTDHRFSILSHRRKTSQ
jgi:hypothetical protein